MISFSSNLRAFVYEEPVHMACSFNGLSGIVRNNMEMNPIDQSLFVFFNRNKTHVKILYWDRTGYAIWTKRLEEGRFLVSEKELDCAGLIMLLEGVLANPAERLKRYSLPVVKHT